MVLLSGLAACAPSGEKKSDSDDKPAPEAHDWPTTSAHQEKPAETRTAKTKAAVPLGTGFDFYVLSLSWSPSYCEAEGTDASRQQCAASRPYAFVVHGL